MNYGKMEFLYKTWSVEFGPRYCRWVATIYKKKNGNFILRVVWWYDHQNFYDGKHTIIERIQKDEFDLENEDINEIRDYVWGLVYSEIRREEAKWEQNRVF